MQIPHNLFQKIEEEEMLLINFIKLLLPRYQEPEKESTKNNTTGQNPA